MQTVYIILDNIRLQVNWTWPQNGDLKILSIKDSNGNDFRVSDFERQIIYEEIIDLI